MPYMRMTGWLRGTLAWKYKTDGPIHFSAAIDSNNQTVYFASNDSYAYALNAATGQLIWKSSKLPSAGFHSWWVVVKDDVVILSASRPYRYATPPQVNVSTQYTQGEPGLSRNGYINPLTNGTIDATPEAQYFSSHPSLKSFYVLNRLTGQESSVLPARSLGTQSGNRYPAVIGPDGDVLTINNFSSDTYGQGVTRWNVGSTIIRPANQVGITAHDEPLAFSMGGNLIYYVQCCDRSGGSVDLRSGQVTPYFAYNLHDLAPGYDAMYAGSIEAKAVSVFGGWNGVYGVHGDQNAPVPYKGKVYLHRSNAVIAFSPTGGAHALPVARTVANTDQLTPVDVNVLKQKLTQEIQKMIAAGHLRPGFGVEGQFSHHGRSDIGDNLTDYWSSPSDTILVLLQALPHLPADVQMSLRTYIQNEFNNYSPANFTHIGWATGAAREAHDLPPEVAADLSNWPATMWSTYGFQGYTGPDWRWPPQTLYALWKYAQVFGNARAIFDSSKGRLWTPPSDAILAKYPFAHNAYIAGYWGYLELEKLAGYPEEADKRAALNRLLALRASNFNKDNPWGPDAQNYNQSFSVARNFVNLTLELADYLRVNAASKVQTTFDEYATIAPYWFVTRFEATYREGVMHHLYDYSGMFAAKALIFNAQREELARYLDVPAFVRGDLFYIQNLIYTIEAQ